MENKIKCDFCELVITNEKSDYLNLCDSCKQFEKISEIKDYLFNIIAENKQ